MAGQLVIGDVFRNAARATPQRVAAAFGDAMLSFGDLDRRSDAVAAALARGGVGVGTPVAVWSGTSLDVVVLFAAASKCGAVFVPLNAGWGAQEVAGALALAGAGLLVVDEPRRADAEEVAGPLRLPVTLLDGVSRGEKIPMTGRAGDVAAAGAAGRAGAVPTTLGPEIDEGDTHVVLFTSGSTGRPKGAVLSHRTNVLRSHAGALLERRGAMVCPYPLFHMGAWTIALQQWQGRDAVVLVEAAEAESICAAVARHRATRLNCVPAVWRRILDHADDDGDAAAQLASIRVADTGTSATPPELLAAMAELLPDAQLRVFYGSTEAGSVAMLEHADVARKPGSCGVPGPLTQVIRQPDGELWVRGPLVFGGYLNDAVATAEAFEGDWYRTGDIAEVDDEGYLTMVGRRSETIRTGGETVAPAEVESVLAAHADIAEVAVVGVPDDRWGEVVCAVVVAAPGSVPPTLADLRQRCQGRLASYKQPRRLAVVDAIPRTSATGQVQRRLLVEQIVLQNIVLTF